MVQDAETRAIVGVPGIGKKGAIDLVTQFGSLDALLERVGELKPKQREALSAHRADALRSRELVTIRTDVPLEVDFESLKYRGPTRERCYELFTRLDFRVILDDYPPPPATADTVQKNFSLVMLGIVFVSLIPAGIEFLRHRRERTAAWPRCSISPAARRPSRARRAVRWRRS